MLLCICASPSGVGVGVCAEYLDLYWSRAAVCSGGVPVYALCSRHTMDSLLNYAAPGLLVYNNIAVDV